METSKIRIKLGEHEFEAEGPPEIVQSQFTTFKELIGSIPAKAETIPAPFSDNGASSDDLLYKDDAHLPLAKILKVSGRVVSLTAIPYSTEDAALLIMLGNKDLRDNELVTGQEIGDGLAQSGRPVARVDRIMEKHLYEAYILKQGLRRATRYRLTNSGHQRALAIAKDLIATLP